MTIKIPFNQFTKHNCGYDYCPYNGLMIRQGSTIAEMSMCFATDESKNGRRQKALRQEKEQQDWKDKR
jgi:hypothetical protein